MTKQEALDAAVYRLEQQCPGIDRFELCDDDEVLLDGTFSAADLRAIVEALESLQAPGAWQAEEPQP